VRFSPKSSARKRSAISWRVQLVVAPPLLLRCVVHGGALVIDVGEVGRDEAAVVGFALAGEILPTGDVVTAVARAALAVGGEVFDRVVPHGVVEGDLLAGDDGLAGDEVVGATGVEADPAVGIAGMVDLGDQAAVQHEAFRADLGGVRVVRSSSRSMTPIITVSPIWKDRVANTPSPLASVPWSWYPSSIMSCSLTSNDVNPDYVVSTITRLTDLPIAPIAARTRYVGPGRPLTERIVLGVVTRRSAVH